MAKKNNLRSGSFNPTPVTRLEKFLAAIAGLVNAPTPVTRKEYWMSKTAARIKAIEEGGGGGGATYTGENGILVDNTNHVISPDMSVLAAKSDLDSIEEVIPSKASPSNMLATMADVGGGGGTEYEVHKIDRQSGTETGFTKKYSIYNDDGEIVGEAIELNVMVEVPWGADFNADGSLYIGIQSEPLPQSFDELYNNPNYRINFMDISSRVSTYGSYSNIDFFSDAAINTVSNKIDLAVHSTIYLRDNEIEFVYYTITAMAYKR